MKRTSALAVMAAIGLQASSSFAATSMVVQNTGEQYTYTADNDLVAALNALRTGFYDQNINLAELNNGNPMEFRPQIQIFTSQPFTGLYPIGQDIEGRPVEPLIIFTTGGQSVDHKQGEAHMMVRLNISPKSTSMDEVPGKRLLLVKADFQLRTRPDHSRPDSQAYVSLYCGSRLVNNFSSPPLKSPAGPYLSPFQPQLQIDDFDFANCRDDLNVYFVADAQDIQFTRMTWMISKVRDPETNTPPPANLVAMCQYKHKEDTAGGQKGAVNFVAADGSDKTCDQKGDWKTTCKDGNGNTDEIGCMVPGTTAGGMCQYKHKKDTKGGKQGQTNAFDASGKQKSCDKNGDWKTICKDGNGDTDEVACK